MRAQIIGKDADHLKFFCRGCHTHHVIVIPPHPAAWNWNEDRQNPTINPSILVQGGERNIVCHSFIRDGRMQYLDDSTHKLRGMTVELPELE